MKVRPSFDLTLETPVTFAGSVYRSLTFRCPRKSDARAARKAENPAVTLLSRICRVPPAVILGLSEVDATHIAFVIDGLLFAEES